MVRNYKRKGEKGKWYEEDTTAAINAVKVEKMTVYKASKQFKIPRETLQSCVIGSVSLHTRAGRPTTLRKDEEAKIGEACQICAEWGFGLWKEDLKTVVADFCRTTKRNNPFKQGVPGDDLWAEFMRRHPSLVRRKPQALQMVRAQCLCAEIVNHLFIECLKSALDFLGLHDHSERNYNVDEVGFPLSVRPTSVLVKKKWNHHSHWFLVQEEITLLYEYAAVEVVIYFHPMLFTLNEGYSSTAPWEDHLALATRVVPMDGWLDPISLIG